MNLPRKLNHLFQRLRRSRKHKLAPLYTKIRFEKVDCSHLIFLQSRIIPDNLYVVYLILFEELSLLFMTVY